MRSRRSETDGPYGVGEEIAHAVTHGAGLALSLAGAGVLVARAVAHGDARQVTGSAVFGAALVLLYAASTLYHAIRHPGAKRVLQRIDHAAIFLLIAGTYTPFTLVSLRGGWAGSLLLAVWGLAALGIVLASLGKGRRMSLGLYLGMGWLAVVVLAPLARTMEPAGIALLVGGGLAYTAGVTFYLWSRLPYHHAIWHVFVLAGSALHYACIAGYVLPSSG